MKVPPNPRRHCGSPSIMLGTSSTRWPTLDLTRISFRAIGVILPVPEGRPMLAVGFIPRLGVGRKPRRVSDG
jgi:hypothetical protein